MNRMFAVLLLAFSGMAYPLAGAADEEYPFRARYPDVQIMTTDELKARLGEVLVVDVRSKYEFDTLHVKGAVHVPLGIGFGEKVAQLRAEHDKPFVFYCNGKTCLKSYDAALLAAKARLSDIYAYDAGIFDWAQAHPDDTVLLGRSPIDRRQVISKKSFTARLLEPPEFVALADNRSLVLDVRDRVQRDNPLFPFKERRAQLDETGKIDAAIAEAKAQGKVLLVYDQAGKQVQWFQYYLESKGVKDYYFMKGGAQGHFDHMFGRVVLGGGDKDK
jgi:rhodanese-related sulfurtransferase